MKNSEQGLEQEQILKLLKEAGIANEQLAKTKMLRNTVNSMINNNDNSIANALKELLKQPNKK